MKPCLHKNSKLKHKLAGAAAALSLFVNFLSPVAMTPVFGADVYWGGGTGAITDNKWFSDTGLISPGTLAPSGDTINIASGTLYIDNTSLVRDSNIGLAAGDYAAVIVTGTWNNTAGELSIGGVSGTSADFPAPTGGDGSLSILGSGSVRASTLYVGSYGSGSLYVGKDAMLYNSANAWFGRNIGGAGTATVDGIWRVGGYTVVGNKGATGDISYNTITINESGSLISTGYLRLGSDINASGTVIVNGFLQVTSTNVINSIGYRGNNATADDVAGTGVLIIGQTGTAIFSGSETTLGHLGMNSGATYRTNGSGTAIVDGVWLLNNSNLKVGRSGAGYLHVGQTGTLKVGTFAYIGDGNSVNNTSHTATGPIGGTAIIDGYMSTNNHLYIGSGANSLGSALVSGILTVGTNIRVGGSGTGTLEILSGGTVIQRGADNYVASAVSAGGSGDIIIRSGGYLNAGKRNDTGNANFGIGWTGTGSMLIEAGGTAVSSGNGGETVAFSLGNNATGQGTATIAGHLIAKHGYAAIGLAGTGTLEIVSGGLVAADRVRIASAATSKGTLILNGGMLETRQIALGAGDAAYIFNGGTIRAAADTDDFFSNFPNLDLGGNTLTLDTQTFAVTATTTLVGTAGATLDKTGIGSLILTANSSAYAGTLNVRTGFLASGNPATKLGGNVNILSGAGLDLRNAALETTGNLTLADGAIWAYSLENQQELLANNLTVQGDGTIFLDLGSLGIGDLSMPVAYTLGTYANGTGIGNLDTWAVSGGTIAFGAAIDTTSVANTITLNVNNAGVDFLYWQGGNGNWDNASATWKISGSPVKWGYGGLGIFDSGAGTVNVSGVQYFDGLQFNVDGYTLAGSGTLAGNVLSGDGSVKFNVINTNATATINTAIVGSKFSKHGSGALTLGGPVNVALHGYVGQGLLTIGEQGYFTLGGSLLVGPTAGTSGTLVVKGLLQSENLFQVGHESEGVVNVASTGTVLVGTDFSIGEGATSSGTVFVSGYMRNDSRNNGWSRVGNEGKGSLIIKEGGYFDTGYGITVGTKGNATGYLEVEKNATLLFKNNKNLILGDADAASGTVVISGSVLNVNTLYIGNKSTGDNTLTINEGGYLGVTANSWYARGDTSTGLNSAYIAGTWDTGGYLVIGNNTGHNILDIASTGTVIARSTGIRITYTHPDSTAYVNVDGYMEAAGTGYIIVAHYGDSYMRIGNTGTAIAGGYISIGQGDTASGGVTNPLTASGTVDVYGYARAGSYLQVGNRLNAVLNVFSDGIVKSGSYLRMGGNASGTGTINLEGTLDIGTYADIGYAGNGTINVLDGGQLTVGSYLNVGPSGTGVLNIAPSGTVNVGTNSAIGGTANGVGIATVEGLWITQNNLYLGRDPANNPSLGNISSGVLDILAGGTVTVGGDFIAAASGTLNNPGVYSTGTARILGTLDVGNNLSLGELGHAYLAIQDGGFVRVSGTTILGLETTGTGSLLLNGGVLETGQIAFGAGEANILFNSGTIRANASVDSFILNAPVLDLDAGDVTIDTNGYDITVQSALAGTSDAVLVKTGSGALGLTANSAAFTGTLTVNAGSLDIASANANIGGLIHVANGGALRSTHADATVSNVTIAAGGALDMRVADMAVDNSITLADGALWHYSLTGTHTLNIASSGTLIIDGSGSFLLDRAGKDLDDIIGSYTLATYTNLVGGSNLTDPGKWSIIGSDFDLTALAELDILIDPHAIKIVISTAEVAVLHWQGGSGVWDTVTSNWDRAGTPSIWTEGALTVFDSGTGNVDVAGRYTIYGMQFGDLGDPNVVVNYTLDGTGTLTAVAAPNVRVLNASSTVTINASLNTPGLNKLDVGTLVLGGKSDFAGTVDVKEGILGISTTGDVSTAEIKIEGSANPQLTVAGLLDNTGTLTIGGTLNGSLTVQDGGLVSQGAETRVAGAAGSGLLRVENGGTFEQTASDLHIGYEATASGTLEVASGGTLEVANSLNVGVYGSGTALINGSATAASAYVGVNEDNTGVVTVVSGGTLATTNQLSIGHNTAASGTLFVDGLVNNSGALYLGNAGTGVLEVGVTGTFANTTDSTTHIGSSVGSSGTAIIRGLWDSAAAIHVGNAGTGSLLVEIGGTLRTVGSSYIGLESTGVGDAVISGYWNNDGSIIVGGTGSGHLKIASTGTLINSNFSGGAADGSSSIVDVDGYWQSANIVLGELSSAVINITANGSVLATGNTTLGNAGGVGTLNVDGLYTSNGAITLGANGSGALNIGEAALVTANSFVVGSSASGTGVISIAASGSAVTAGQYRQGVNGILDIIADTSRSTAYITADSASLSGTLQIAGASFAYTPVAKASEISDVGIRILDATSGTIAGNFTNITGIGGSGLPDYIAIGGQARDNGDGTASYYAGYRLAWNTLSGAHGTFTIEEGETFEVDTKLGDRFGPGPADWDGKSLTKLGTGTLILSGSNSFTGTLNIAEGTVQLGGPVEHRYGQLANHGVLNIGNIASDDYRSVEVKGLSGNGSVLMNVNPGTGESDRLIVNGDAEGTHNLVLGAAASSIAPTSDSPAPVLATISGENNATFTGGLDFEGTNYAVVQSAPGTIILATNGQSDAFSAISSVHGAQSVMWFASQDNLYRRIGELRSISEEPSGKYSVWLRARAENSSFSSSTNMRPFDMDLYGFEIGADKTIAALSGRMALGVYLGYGHASQDFDARNGSADGDSDQLSLGAYAAWMNAEGWFANATLTGALYDNEFTSTAQNGSTPTKGSYDDTAIGLSLEVGKRIALDQKIGAGWFAEPSTQLSLVYLMRDDYTTKGDNLAVDSDDATIARLRATLRAGRAWKLANSHIEIAGRIGAAYEDSSGGKIRVNDGTPWRPNVDGARGEAGVGLIWRPTAAGQLYFDYEFATGEGYQKPWSISLGYRHAF
ncbi:outer membrane autotransporter protein [Ereboglobus sp. PH5-5]|uniref:autotransporter outer membrane beta-barrel domain-containing protein n=1 Tax=Ereboglobus sp. PH5-5 TaxID=2940529 RepID=UPI0024064387|nr:autotransporter outer membrane beta-barrel domain-containing protein [Ereboglobus sp. PH5-5]MDF9832160.1 outer membrane autotransporter protein [Ereboglobus sp. PH5-5]